MRFPFALTLTSAFLISGLAACGAKPAATTQKAAVIAVTAIQPIEKEVAPRLKAYGAVQPWQESSIGVEVGGLRIKELLVETGDSVSRGQLLARLNDEGVRADVAVQRAALQDAEAAAAQAVANAERARRLKADDAISEQDYLLAVTAEKTTQAKVAMVKAQLDAQQVRLRNTQITAPDDGVISARAASVGQVIGAGAELFKLIRQHRLEWRAEVPADQLGALAIGGAAYVPQASGVEHAGKIRQIAPSLDSATKTGLVYVDLERTSDLKAGNYVQGEFQLATTKALTVPASTVLRRDGRKYVGVLEGESVVRLREVELGPLTGKDIVVAEGLTGNEKIVATGLDFVSDGDTVRVVAEPAPGAAQ